MVTRRQVLKTGVIGIGSTLLGQVTRAGGLAQQTAPVNLKAAMPRAPVTAKVPPGACDTHVHVFGDRQRYPYAATAGYNHGPATPADLDAMLKALHVDRVVIVQPSAYGTDNRCTLDGVEGVTKLGRKARGIVAIDEKTTDKELDEMDRRGARGIRMNMGQTVEESRKRLETEGRRLSGRKWLINSAPRLAMLEGIQDAVMAMPVPLVCDHWVYSDAAAGINQPGFDVLLKLLKSGKVYVKITHNLPSLGLATASDYSAAVGAVAKAMIDANPQRVIWGSDWPHAGGRPEGFARTDLSPYRQQDDGLMFNHLLNFITNEKQRQMVLVENPARLFGF